MTARSTPGSGGSATRSGGSAARSMLVVALVASVALAACGPAPPQPPLHEAKKLGASTGDIATECGLAFQITAFPGGHHKALANLETSAMFSVRSLASVYARNPAWIYQGETVHDVVRDAIVMLRGCGLPGAAGILERRTGVRVS